MKKRILAGLLSAMMICSIVPVADYFTSGDILTHMLKTHRIRRI